MSAEMESEEDYTQAFEYHETHLVIEPGITWEKWLSGWGSLKQTHQSINFWLGDAILYAQTTYPDTWSQVVDGSDFKRLRGAIWTCSKIPRERRRKNVSYSIHKAVAGMEPDAQDRWLERAAEGKWTVEAFQDELEAEAEKAKLNGHLSNSGEPIVPHGTDEPAEPEAIDIEPEPEPIRAKKPKRVKNIPNDVEIDALREMIENLKADDFDIDSFPLDLTLSGWQIDIDENGKGWEVRLKKEGQKQAIAINERLSAAVFEALLAARISDLSA